MSMFGDLALELSRRAADDRAATLAMSPEEYLRAHSRRIDDPAPSALHRMFTEKPKHVEVGERMVHIARSFGTGVVEKLEFTDQEPLAAPGGGPCWVAQVRWDDTGKVGTVWAVHLSPPNFTFDDELAGGW